MDQIYLTEINMRQVRHLRDVKIELSQNEKKHLLLTGINGCGKTSVLNAIISSLFQSHGFMGQTWNVVNLNHSSDKIQIKSNCIYRIGDIRSNGMNIENKAQYK